MGKKLILFDLDGVLLDSKQNMEIAWGSVCKKHNINVDFADYFSHIGRPFQDILTILGINENQKQVEQTFEQTSIQNIDKVSFYLKTQSTLKTLIDRHIKIGIVTSKNTNKTHTVLKLLGVDFDIVQTPNTQLQGKPAPDHLLHAMKTLQVEPKNTLYIGDMDVDYQTAKNANIDYMHAQWGYGDCNDKSIVKLTNLSQILDLIK